MFVDAGVPDLASLVVTRIRWLEDLTAKCASEGVDIEIRHRWGEILLPIANVRIKGSMGWFRGLVVGIERLDWFGVGRL
jgi:hypothetical protein